MSTLALNRQIFQDNNTQAQIPSFAVHQRQQHHQRVVILCSIMFTIALNMMYSFHSFMSSLMSFFRSIETTVFLMLGFCPVTAFRIFPPLEQLPAHCSDSYINSSSLAILLCPICLFLEFGSFLSPRPDAGWLTSTFRPVVGNNRVLNFFFSLIRWWLYMSGLSFLNFQLFQDPNPDILLFLVKERLLRKLF